MYFKLDHFSKFKFPDKFEILDYLPIKDSNMPGIIERPKMTKVLHQSLKKYIMREHEKKKQEQEQDKELQRRKQEREIRKKKEEQDSLTLEQTKEQLLQLKKKREQLVQEKEELYSKLKEDESKRKARDQNEAIGLQSYTSGLTANGPHPVFYQGGMLRQNTKYMNAIPQSMIPSLKRRRSPSPSLPNTIYPSFNVNNVKYGLEMNKESFHSHGKPPVSFPGQSTHVTYVSQPGQSYQPPHSQKQQSTLSSNPSSTNCKFVASHSAFSSYPNHFSHQQKQMTNHFPPPQGYQIQGVHNQPQSGYMNTSLAVAALAAASDMNNQNIPLQQQLEHANKKSGFSDEKFKQQQQQQQQQNQQQHIRNLSQTQRNQLASHQSSSPTMAQQKGSIVTGYPVRTQPSSPYPQASVQVSHSNSPVAARHVFNNSQPGGRPYY